METHERAQAALLLPSQARIERVGLLQGEPHISVPGMIRDLRTWNVPPDLINGEAYGFLRALADVQRYLAARVKHG